ncbi:VOC family protein [Prescottella agglutinans]|uniref:Methylmalonyl-CoA/ethylmalonyl-CoA epimerase n=1 Tax=Prescottella agglutinans TaxID=1644129 RepID=A0ABT6MBK8_9NOCA|nr:VOC family protein [Prescottella agglutinans]MDH6281620.1 methylmalonyl-CoA/ethylmalonyl-CoA epimerase [Prescottella agglutinans]
MGHEVPEPAVQMGYVVADLDAAVEHWLTHARVGPWTVFRGVTLNGTYAGAGTVVTMDVAMGYTGELQIELMQITSSTPSPYTNDAGEPLVGPHHIAWITDDLDAALAAAHGRGLEDLFVAEGPGTRVAYVHSPAQPGVVFEYIQSDGMRAMLEYGIEQARAWDGSNPVRPIA